MFVVPGVEVIMKTDAISNLLVNRLISVYLHIGGMVQVEEFQEFAARVQYNL